MRSRVIICEASELITIGLVEIIDGMAQFDVVARLDNPEHLSEKILATDANLVIINPTLLGCFSRDFLSQLGKECPQVTVIALVTTCVDYSMLTPYSGIIEINDTKSKIISKMNEFARGEATKNTDDVELSNEHLYPYGYLASQKHH